MPVSASRSADTLFTDPEKESTSYGFQTSTSHTKTVSQTTGQSLHPKQLRENKINHWRADDVLKSTAVSSTQTKENQFPKLFSRLNIVG